MNRIELIKKRLSDEIKTSGKTQTEIAQKINVSQSCIAHYIKGDIVPAIDTLAEICALLELDSNYILGLEKAENRKTYNNINNNFSNNNGTINQTINNK